METFFVLYLKATNIHNFVICSSKIKTPKLCNKNMLCRRLTSKKKQNNSLNSNTFHINNKTNTLLISKFKIFERRMKPCCCCFSLSFEQKENLLNLIKITLSWSNETRSLNRLTKKTKCGNYSSTRLSSRLP